MKKSFFVVLLLHLVLCGHAQLVPEFTSEIPPLPESVVFRNYTGYTPSLSTGAVNVNIPLYEINVNDFVLPISLNYYTTGIKVEDTADPLGYGWVLNPGLRITRTVRGRPDESHEIKPYRLVAGDSFYQFMYGKRALADYPSRTPEDIAFDQVIGTSTVIDTQYDVFTLHLPHASEFFVYNNGRIEALNPLIKIVPKKIGTRIAGFEVTDEKGINYYFGAYTNESLNTTPPCIEQPTYSAYYTAWGLRKIKFPGSQHEINITWQKAYTEPRLNQAYLENRWFVDDKLIADPTCFDLPSFVDGNYRTKERQQALRIQEIQFPGGKATFTYTGSGYSQLTTMQVRNNANALVRNIGFEYNTQKTLLTKVVTSHEGTYKFTYNPQQFNSILSQDYWGYYNGKTNSDFIPNFKTGFKQPLTTEIFQIGTADRSPDAECTKANILTRVDYPTGGWTEFEYELHQFTEEASVMVHGTAAPTKGRGLRVCKTVTKADNTSQPITKTYTYANPMLTWKKTLDSFFDQYHMAYLVPQSTINSETTARKVNVYSQSLVSSLFVSTPSIFYTSVEECVGNTHKTQYEFRKFVPDDVSVTPRPIVRNLRLKSGSAEVPYKKIHYKKVNQSYVPVEEWEYAYKEYALSYWDNYVGIQLANTLDHDGPHFLFYSNIQTILGSFDPYYITDTYLGITKYLPEKEKRTIYTDAATISEITEYTYTGTHLLREKKTSSSSGESIVETYTYLDNTSYPRIISRTQSGKKETKRIEYTGGGYLPYTLSAYKGDTWSDNDIRVEYSRYNKYGKPVSVTLNSAAHITYIWGYNSLFPLAEIKNATYSDILLYIPQATLDAIANNATPTAAQLELVNGLRLKLPQAQVSTYTYKPLIGMTSATEPSGLTTFYDYHTDGRLKEVYLIKNKVKNTLKRYEYKLIYD